MSQPAARPWYVDLVKEIGGLGLVLVMLVGIYFLAQDYAADMKKTWEDIRSMTETQLEEERFDREQISGTITKFIAEQQNRMTEHAARMNAIEDRMSRLEQ